MSVRGKIVTCGHLLISASLLGSSLLPLRLPLFLLLVPPPSGRPPPCPSPLPVLFPSMGPLDWSLRVCPSLTVYHMASPLFHRSIVFSLCLSGSGCSRGAPSMASLHLLLPLLFLPLLHAVAVNLQPRQIVHELTGEHRFGGERNGSEGSGASNHFKLLEQDGDSLLVGARNFVYNLSMATMGVGHRMAWAPAANAIETCTMKGKSHDDCQNYIRVLARQAEGQVLICGTNAFSPKCRIYHYDPLVGGYKNTVQFEGAAISPYDPHDNSTAVYLRRTDEIVSGTVSDFVGGDPVIYRRKLTKTTNDVVGIRTQRDDARVLDSPNFVASFEYKEHIYFWFRERASEAVDNNEEKQVYARVARVCKDDKGGPRPANDRWTTFLKARLNCSIPTASPFYFNELKAVADPVPSTGSDHSVYAVFSTPESSVRMSAICVFSMQAIRDNFDRGTFKAQKTAFSQWREVSRGEVPSPRPGTCTADSSKTPEATISFITRNPLMHEAVRSRLPPLFVEGSNRAALTQIAVLSRVESVEGGRYDVIYVGTSDGRVLKAVQAGNETVIVQSVSVFPSGAAIVNLLTTSSRVVAVSADEVASIPTEQCSHAKSCGGCVRLRDPHCAWDESISQCVSRSESGSGWRNGDVIQNIVRGESAQCPETGNEEAIVDSDMILSSRVTSAGSSDLPSSSGLYTASVVALSCLACVIVSSVVGFVVGWRVALGKKMAEAHHSTSSTSGSDYDSYGRARLTRHDSLTNASGKLEQIYVGGPPSKHSVDATSLVMPAAMSISHHGGSGTTTPGRDRNALMTSLNNTTLPRDYKVKKVYL